MAPFDLLSAIFFPLIILGTDTLISAPGEVKDCNEIASILINCYIRFSQNPGHGA